MNFMNEIDRLFQAMIKKECLSKEDIGKICTILATLFSLGVWGIKSLWYTYQAGKLSIYHIDTCYIDVGGENTVLKTIQIASILLLWGLVNYIYYRITIMKYDKIDIVKYRFRKVGFLIIEIFTLLIYVIVKGNISPIQLWRELTIFNFAMVLLDLGVCCIIINLVGSLLALDYKKFRKNEKENSEYQLNLINILVAIIVTYLVMQIFCWFHSTWTEYNRNDYKVVKMECFENKQGIFYDKYQEKWIEIYPVVFENKECYILCKLESNNDEIKVDYSYQKIIDKNNVEIVYISDIDNIKDYGYE